MSGKSIKSTGIQFPSNFFEALNNSESDGAVDALKKAAFGVDAKPSPKAQELIDAGEWDQEQKLSLVFVDSSCCFGCVGGDSYRFCGKRKTHCTIASHTKNLIEGVRDGWYIANAGKNSGVYVQPALPDEPEGPIRTKGAALLVDGDTPFRLTKGQWKLIIDSWHADRVQSIDDEA